MHGLLLFNLQIVIYLVNHINLHFNDTVIYSCQILYKYSIIHLLNITQRNSEKIIVHLLTLSIPYHIKYYVPCESNL